MSGYEITDADLTGPVVDRRTTVKLLGATGVGGMAALAGCSSDPGGSGGEGGGNAGGTDGGEQTAGTTASGEPKRGGRLQAGWFTGSIDNLDPSYITVGINAQVMANVFNALVQTTSDLRIVPDLAKDWTVENKTKYTFQLREGVTFHNGTPFTAEDVRYTIVRIFKEDTPVKAKMTPLRDPTGEGVVVVDDYTVELNLQRPYAPLLSVLARGDGRGSTVVCKEAIEEMGPEQYAVTPVGTGPFEVTSHEVGSSVTLDAFDDYFGTDEAGNQLPYLDGVDVKPIPEAAQIVNALKAEDIQFANSVPRQNVSSVKQASGVRLVSGPAGGWIGLAMNNDDELFANRKTRRGIAKSIDAKAFVEQAYFGNAHVAEGPIAPAHGWAFREDKADDQHYAPEEGAALLEETGAKGASFSILTMQRDLRAAKAMRNQLQRAGLDASIEQVTTSTYWERYEKGDYDTTVSGNAVDLDPDASLYLFFYTRGEGGVFNWVNFSDERVNDLLDRQRRIVDRNKRAEVLHTLEDRIIAEAPHAYTHHEIPFHAARERVNGYDPHPINRDFHEVWLAE